MTGETGAPQTQPESRPASPANGTTTPPAQEDHSAHTLSRRIRDHESRLEDGWKAYAD